MAGNLRSWVECLIPNYPRPLPVVSVVSTSRVVGTGVTPTRSVSRGGVSGNGKRSGPEPKEHHRSSLWTVGSPRRASGYGVGRKGNVRAVVNSGSYVRRSLRVVTLPRPRMFRSQEGLSL